MANPRRDPFKVDRLERRNAQEWESDSVISFSTANDNHNSAVPIYPIHPPRPIAQTEARPPTTSVYQVTNRKENVLPRPARLPPAKTLWADPAGLVTTRRAQDLEEREAIEAEKRKYLHAPDPEEEFAATGYYIWLDRDTKPTDLLGGFLEKLAMVKITYKVYIEWHEKQKHLKVSHREPYHAEENIADAIKGIRDAIEDARAQAKMANPVYIVIPPTATAMRTKVLPREAVRLPRRAKYFVLAGEPISENEKRAWKARRHLMIERNFDRFKTHLRDSLLNLKGLKTGMKMRVHLGHVVLTQFKTEFMEGRQNFKDFVDMMGSFRLQGKFEEEIGDARTAMHLREKIINWPERFCPADGQIQSLNDIKFKDTVVMLLEHRGVGQQQAQSYRLEGDVDCTFETVPSEYQLGSVRLFYKDRTDKRVDITMMDIERVWDWQLKVVSDNSRETIPEDIYSIIAESVTAKSRGLRDELGLEYPEIRPKNCYGVEIISTVLRSVIQYMLIDSGYIVEIAIYRIWQGSNTKVAPRMAAGVSMFHRSWDTEMASIEGSVGERGWTKDLVNFFDGERGLKGFIDEVDNIQGHLIDANNEVGDVARAVRALL